MKYVHHETIYVRMLFAQEVENSDIFFTYLKGLCFQADSHSAASDTPINSKSISCRSYTASCRSRPTHSRLLDPSSTPGGTATMKDIHTKKKPGDRAKTIM